MRSARHQGRGVAGGKAATHFLEMMPLAISRIDRAEESRKAGEGSEVEKAWIISRTRRPADTRGPDGEESPRAASSSTSGRTASAWRTNRERGDCVIEEKGGKG